MKYKITVKNDISNENFISEIDTPSREEAIEKVTGFYAQLLNTAIDSIEVVNVEVLS